MEVWSRQVRVLLENIRAPGDLKPPTLGLELRVSTRPSNQLGDRHNLYVYKIIYSRPSGCFRFARNP